MYSSHHVIRTVYTINTYLNILYILKNLFIYHIYLQLVRNCPFKLIYKVANTN